jgi:Tol biopolymer transport system component
MNKLLAIATAVLTGSTVLLAAAPAQGTAHGKNGRIAFRRYYNAAQTRGDIFTIRRGGTAERQVTHSKPTQLATEPDWSPSGRWIVYQEARGGDIDNSRLYKIHPDGSDRTFIDKSCQAPCLSDGFAQWAPHGRRIAFQRQFGPTGDPTFLFALYVMRRDGTHVRQITHRGADPLGDNRFQDRAPTWSPSATRLAFERDDGKTGHAAIYTLRLNGTGHRRITPWRLDAGQPDWSPNGRWILFHNSGDVWLVHPNGSDLHRVTHTAPGAGTWGSGSFSPNGHRIVNSHSPGVGAAGNADVYAMRLNGSNLRNITASRTFESAPDWGPRPHGATRTLGAQRRGLKPRTCSGVQVRAASSRCTPVGREANPREECGRSRDD